MAPTLITLPAATITSIAAGTTRCIDAGGRSLIVHKSRDGELTVGVNACEHLGDKFAANRDIEDSVLACPSHGARLDASTMTYADDARLFGVTLAKMRGRKHPQYVVKRNADGSVLLKAPAGSEGSLLADVLGAALRLALMLAVLAAIVYVLWPKGSPLPTTVNEVVRAFKNWRAKARAARG